MIITKRLEFDAGHRLVGHESKCANLHGHRYAAEVSIKLLGDADLDAVGRVVDFSVVKAVFGKWIDDILDHAFIVNEADPLLEVIKASGKHVVVGCEPTAENLATWMLNVAAQLLDDDRIRVIKLRLWETPTSSATARRTS